MTRKEITAAATALATFVGRARTERGLLRLTCENTGFQLEIECDARYQTELTIVLCMWDMGDETIYEGAWSEANMSEIAHKITMHDVIIENLK
jgi:hypothetical protein